MTMKNKILVIDGSNLLFQMFFGMPARITNADGMGIWGVVGFVGALLTMLRLTEPTHAAVLFDGEHENKRVQVDADYKANRPGYQDVPAEDNPFSQLPYIQKALCHLGIAWAETTDCEADDWMAGYARRYAPDCEVVIASHDRDLLQLIGEHVSILHYRGKQSYFCDSAYLYEKYGIMPCQYADFRALTGDPSDNIKGAEGIGPKTASGLLHEFGTLAGVLGQAEKIRKPSVRESICRNRERLLNNYRLIRLDGEVDLPFGLDEMAYYDKGHSTMAVLHEIGL